MRIHILMLLLLLTHFVFAQEKLVRLNDHMVNVYMKGFENRKTNSPAIIFESGLGMDLGNWDTIIDSIAAFAPVFAYDRPGIGKSDKVFRMPTVKTNAENLKALLTTLKIAPPYILVGHSLGGLYVRGFAGLYPNDIAAAVFIDPADFTETKEQWNAIFRAIGVPEKKIGEMLQNRLYKDSEVDSARYGPWSETEVLKEQRRTDFAEVRALYFPHVPVYFFIGGKFEVPPEQRSKDFNQEAFFQERTKVNIERWRKFIDASGKGGSLIYLSPCGHFVHRDDPKAVIHTIKFIVSKGEL